MIRFPRVPLAVRLVLALAIALAATLPSVARAEASPPSIDHARLGDDILALERLRLRHPMDADVRARLADRRSEAGLPATSPGLLKRWTGLLSLDAWAWIGLAGLGGIALWLLRHGVHPWLVQRGWRVGVGRRGPARSALVAAALLVVLAGASIAIHLPDATASIVTDGPAPLRISPFSEAASRAALPVGARVHVERAFADHLYVRDERGREGWLSRHHLDAIWPNLSKM